MSELPSFWQYGYISAIIIEPGTQVDYYIESLFDILYKSRSAE